ncbi:cupin [Paracoccaceae bacterium Fryx2]|nr:cupin [Paracoccaceae bacterium Fryx2]
MINDDRVHVTRFDFVPGAETGMQRHMLDYVITALTDCPMLMIWADGAERRVLVPAGTCYRRDAGAEHNVICDGDEDMSFVEVELK